MLTGQFFCLSLLSFNVTNLHSQADDTEIPCEDVPELEFTVATAVVTPSRSETEFPRQGPIVEHKELTVGKPGGPTLGGPSCYCP